MMQIAILDESVGKTACPPYMAIRASRQAKRERGIWQRRYWEHQIRNENDFEKHVDYIHLQPGKAWLC